MVGPIIALPPPVPDRPRQCHYLLPSKRKYCGLTCKAGNKFCGEHSMFETVDPSKDAAAAQGGQTTEGKPLRRRIPCPFDPSQYVFSLRFVGSVYHAMDLYSNRVVNLTNAFFTRLFSTAWEDDLRAHLFKCNARPKDAPAQFKLDVNLTLPAPEKSTTTSLLGSSTTTLSEAVKGGSEVLSALSDEELVNLIKKIQDLHAKYVPEIKTMILDHTAMDERRFVFFSRSSQDEATTTREGKRVY